LAFAFLPLGSVAVSAKAEQARVVRKEPQRVHLSADGETSQEHGSFVQSAGTAKIASVDSSGETIVGAGGDSPDLEGLMCDNDYPVGKALTSNCAESNETLIENEEECIEAAKEAGAKVLATTQQFKIAASLEYHRPKGCYKDACPLDDGVCYFFNGVGGVPNVSVGTPICRRPKHFNGTKNKAGGCPHGYALVDDEDECRASADCLNYVPGNQFRQANHSEWVRGCFINDDPDKLDGAGVYFNVKVGEDASEEGTQICKVPNATATL